MDTTVADLVYVDPVNPIHDTGYRTQTDKAWARAYHPIRNLVVHTRVGQDRQTYSSFDAAFHSWDEDDTLRMACAAAPPNQRAWRLETEADCELWFHTEISNIVLAAWNEYRGVTQSSHIKPPRTDRIPEEVDSTYTVKVRNERTVLAIGEMKRNLVENVRWQQGSLGGSMGQVKLSQELRGYADKYQCPHVFCFDGKTLVLLQFRANRLEDIREEHCPVDCWVFPRDSSTIPLRYALYMLLVQGFRRFQGAYAQPLTVGGLAPQSRQFFDGLPVWTSADGDPVLEHPGGYQRSVDPDSGALRWTHPENDDLVWETEAFWGEHAAP
ncbi:hypothetical protein C8A00DRAFT_16102 [Chaetomidium leptoderma]|uniref:Uncharacterized protein n=1 Tax=Chaetomidium leptoderma TaxID=669021 RepID=A0AAN6VK47_9PEZI|nr:hypothetical protein C8A00DRAFT_16102 [Chaetomidium leptoderma]